MFDLHAHAVSQESLRRYINVHFRYYSWKPYCLQNLPHRYTPLCCIHTLTIFMADGNNVCINHDNHAFRVVLGAGVNEQTMRACVCVCVCALPISEATWSSSCHLHIIWYCLNVFVVPYHNCPCTIITLCACARGKAIGSVIVVVVVDTKITKSWDLGNWVSYI